MGDVEHQKAVQFREVTSLSEASVDHASITLAKAAPEQLVEVLPDPVAAYLDGLKSPRSRTTMDDALRRAARADGREESFSAWWTLRPDQFTTLRKRLSEQHRPATVSLSLVALRGVLKTSWRMGLMSHEQFARATDWGKTLRGSRLPAGRHIPDEERTKIVAYVDSIAGEYGALVRGCFAMMLGGALRAFEVCGLVVEAYDPTARTVRFVGKGDKESVVPLQSEDAAKDVDAWLATRSTMSSMLPWMFLRAKHARAARGEMLSVKWLEHLCLSVATGAGVPRFSPHDCRRTVATGLLESGVDLATVQRILRHESPDTTARYDRRQALVDAERIRAAPSIYRRA
jgi:integrase